MREEAESFVQRHNMTSYNPDCKVLDLMTPTAQEGSTLDPPKTLLAGQKK
jgi:hypothetical protein